MKIKNFEDDLNLIEIKNKNLLDQNEDLRKVLVSKSEEIQSLEEDNKKLTSDLQEIKLGFEFLKNKKENTNKGTTNKVPVRIVIYFTY